MPDCQKYFVVDGPPPFLLAELQNSALNLMCGGRAGGRAEVNNWFPDCKSNTF